MIDKIIVDFQSYLEESGNRQGGKLMIIFMRIIGYNDNIRDKLLNIYERDTCKQVDLVQAIVSLLINEIGIKVLINTGSDFNIMSVGLFELVNNIYNVPVLPVANCLLSGAIGTSSVPTKSQVQVEFWTQGERLNSTFLIVPYII